MIGIIKRTFLPKTSLQEKQLLQDPGYVKDVMGLRLLLYWKNMWVRMMCCLQIIWRENRESQQRSWSAAILHGEDVVQAGCD